MFETGSKYKCYPVQNLLRELIIRRTVGEHEAEFALQCIKPGPNYYGPERHGRRDVYRVELDSSQPLIKTAQQRKWTIDNEINTWGAGGKFANLIFSDGSKWVATLYRDAGAPSWPDHYTTPSGLSHFLATTPEYPVEEVDETSNREFLEELVFLNKQNLGSIGYDSKGRVYAFLNENSVPAKIIDDKKTLIQVFRDGELVDECKPFAVGWGTKLDTVTTVVTACTMYPDMVIPERQNVILLNGEIVRKEDTIGVRSREVALLNLDDFYRKRQMVGTIHYRARFDEDLIEVVEDERPRDEIKMTEQLRKSIEKVLSMSEQEYQLWFS